MSPNINMLSLLAEMETHSQTLDFSKHVSVEPNTVAGEIAIKYNNVVDAFCEKAAQMRQVEEHLWRAEKLVTFDQLSAGVIHEFNNLLQVIQGYTEIALEGFPSRHRAFQDLEQAIAATKRAAIVVRKLLQCGRQETLEQTPLNVGDTVQGIAGVIGLIIGERIELSIVVDEHPAIVIANQSTLEEILVNLCINARDAMTVGGKLTIYTTHVNLDQQFCESHGILNPGHYVHLSVCDTGCGMPREIQKRIFEPYFTTKEVGKGTGLGLPMVQSAVQEHGGMMFVESEPSVGSSFNIFLPDANQPAPVRANRSATQERMNLDRMIPVADVPFQMQLATKVDSELEPFVHAHSS